MSKNRVKTATLLESLDALIEEYHLLKHPFYQAWTKGTLSREALQLYAEQYYQHVQRI
jgi:pyrroloquinoline-quinone synthase